MNEAPFPNFLPTFKPLFPSLKFAQQVVFGNFSTLTAISLTTELSLFPLEPYTVQLSIMEGKHRSTVLLYTLQARERTITRRFLLNLGAIARRVPKNVVFAPRNCFSSLTFRHDTILFHSFLSLFLSLPPFLSSFLSGGYRSEWGEER